MNMADHQTRFAMCGERRRYMEDFLESIRELAALQSEQAKAVIEGDPDFARFDLLIHIANEKKDHAKYALLLHIEEHHC
jgi:hypothetical protein